MPPHALPPAATGSLPWVGGWRHPAFRAGVRDMVAPQLGIAAWALVTGVAMVKGGLGVPLALLMSLTVFAGSAQLAALPLLAAGAPLGVLWATALCVNLRFVIFSAGLRPFVIHLPRWKRMGLAYVCADLSYVVFMQHHANEEPGRAGQAEYLAGCCAVNWLGWQVASVAGIVLADVIPTEWGLGFAGVLALLGLACGLLTDRASAGAAAVAGLVAVAVYALPLRLNVVVAIAAAVATGLMLERAFPPRPPLPKVNR